MSTKGKTLCGWKKSDYTPENLLKVVSQPKFFCEDCGRVAKKKKYLCEPKRLINEKQD